MRAAARAASWALAAALASQGAGAQQGIEAAKTFFEAGVQAYTAGRYGAAVEAFSESYRSSPKPQILFSMAQAERKLYIAEKNPDVLRRAIEHFRQYLGDVEQGGRRGDATEALAELEVLAARLVADGGSGPIKAKTRLLIASSTRGATLSFDGKPAGELPFIDEVRPGAHRIIVSAEGYLDEEREVTSVEGATLAVDIALKPRPSKLSIAARRGAEVYVDARLVGLAPAAPVDVQAGEHTVVVIENGRTAFSAKILVALGKNREVTAVTRPTTQRQVAYAVGALGASSLLASGLLTFGALRKQQSASDINERAAAGNLSPRDLDTYRSARDSRDNYRAAAAIAFGAGAALGAGALGLFLFDRPSLGDVTSVPTSLSPEVGRGFVGALARGTF